MQAHISFVQHKNLVTLWSMEVIISTDLTPIIRFKGLELVYSKPFNMNRPQTYRRSKFYVGWMRSMLVCNNTLSPLETWWHFCYVNDSYGLFVEFPFFCLILCSFLFFS